MAVRPIIFSGPMVRALLNSRKTQTRRVLKPQPTADCAGFEKVFAVPPFFEARDSRGRPIHPFPVGDGCASPFPPVTHAPGDLMWVREAWAQVGGFDPGYLVYRSTYPNCLPPGVENVPEDIREAGYRWHPSIHMPRWASRLTLEITDVRVQRLQDISEDDARAEGVLWVPGHGEITYDEMQIEPGWSNYLCCRQGFEVIWDSLNSKRGWSWRENPWVVALTFSVHRRNVDDLLKEREAT